MIEPGLRQWLAQGAAQHQLFETHSRFKLQQAGAVSTDGSGCNFNDPRFVVCDA